MVYNLYYAQHLTTKGLILKSTKYGFTKLLKNAIIIVSLKLKKNDRINR